MVLLLLALPVVVQAQSYTNSYGIWTYVTTNGTITITKYTGPGGDVTIPDIINGLPVTTIGDFALFDCWSLSSVTIPNNIMNIGYAAIADCLNLTNVTIGNGVTSIGYEAFADCVSLTGVTIPVTVTSIGDYAFFVCQRLRGVYFTGSVPSVGGTNVFTSATNTIVYYLPGTTGWSPTFAGRPTAQWFLPNPLILNNSFGIQTNQFGFIISWATNVPVVVEACTNLANPTWSSVGTNALTNGSAYFSDPQWTNYPARFYRIRSP
jgi:hypothetical protein